MIDINNPDISTDYEESYSQICALLDRTDFQTVMNEAQTRFVVIDDILSKCLGWNRIKDIQVEPNTGAGYADYILSTSKKSLVLEAKRTGIVFQVPTAKKPQTVPLESLLKSNIELKEAIMQVASYSQAEGVPLAVISNGAQYIGFLASRSDGQRPFDGKAVVFSSLKQVKENFIEFWNLFSRNGVINRNLEIKLSSSIVAKKAVKPSTLIDNYPGTQSRNNLQTNLMTLSELILEDLTHKDLEKEFLKYCYCESGALSQHSLLARDLIKNRYEQIDDKTNVKIERIRNKQGISEDFLSSSMSQRPIILMGDVGVGKSTFIRNLIVSDDSVLKDSDIALHLDLGHQSILSSDIKSGCLTSIKRTLLELYKINIDEDILVRKVYEQELILLKQGIYKGLDDKSFKNKEIEQLGDKIADKAEHIKRTIDYFATNQGKRIVIFLDNADQRSSNDQQDIFLIAHELASQTSSVVFVTIRPETFYASYKRGVLKAYHPKVFTIEPPRIDLVLKKRLEFGLKLTEGKIPVPSLDSSSLKLDTLSTMLKVMINTINSNSQSQKKLVKFIDNMAFGNTRSAIDMVKDFFGSGQINTKKILEIEQEKPNTYLVPLHEFVKSIVYGNNIYYSPADSMVTNIYDIHSHDPREYFITLVILNEMVFLGSEKQAKGFINTKEVYNRIMSLGYNSEQIEKTLEDCLRDDLLENPVNSDLGLPDSENHIRITPKGACYTNILGSNFQYVEAIIMDTPFVNQNDLDFMIESYKSGDISVEKRLDRTDRFMLMLSKIYHNDEKLSKDNRTSSLVNKILTDYAFETDYIRKTVAKKQEIDRAS